MRKVRLGQTEQGSYVVTLVCPVSPELQLLDATIDPLGEPYDRRVTPILAGALQKTAWAAQEAGLKQDLAPFTDAIQDGVSSNLCKALAEIGSGLEEGEIEVSFSWSRSRRRRPNVPTSRIVISTDAIPVIREAARVLRETYSDDDFELSGPVVRLDSADVATGGDVLIFTEVDTWRRVKVHLEGPDYAAAVDAHQKGLEVRCNGRLEKEGRYFTLKNVRSFGVQDAPF
jgi:hypothetical protein